MESRIRNALLLYSYALLGIFLVVVPWTPVWEEAIRVLARGRFASWLAGGGVRGTASALGVLDLVVAGQFARAVWGGVPKKKAAPGTPPAKPQTGPARGLRRGRRQRK